MSCCAEGLSRFLGFPVAQHQAPASLPKPEYEGKGRRFVNAHHENADAQLLDFYDLGERKGAGSFGTVHMARSKRCGRTCVVKTMDKLEVPEDIFAYVANEIEILSFCDHPNIIRIYHTFESELEVQIAMQCCSGGDIEARLEKDGYFNESASWALMHQLLRGVHYLHTVSRIAHRDLKCENILLKTHEEDLSLSQVKIIDFGFARGFQPGICSFDDICGTPAYMAPEVFSGPSDPYDEKCDIFSCGVILYEMISGSLPFFPKSSNIENSLDCIPDFSVGLNFDELHWQQASGQVKLLTKKLCKVCPSDRISAGEALVNPWIRNAMTGTEHRAPLETRIPAESLNRVSNSIAQMVAEQDEALAYLRSEVVHRVAYHLEDHDIECERRLFEALDKDGDGRLTKDECAELCRLLGICESAAAQILERMDADGSGCVGYTEFLSGAILGSKCSKASLRAAFCTFDKNNDGQISADELREMLCEHQVSEGDFRRLVRQADENDDGVLDFEEFQKLSTLKEGDYRTPSKSLVLSPRTTSNCPHNMSARVSVSCQPAFAHAGGA
eukprot:TRINITY_DN17377_c0_g1_i1.p1 TRINITY_DN17377_c0_g1~~TRINITY_DN17377_c0_g1_i1.p1  ORF type:complete len:558 (-),score=106.61 TRINITY_DN17377_c0_g1_i1:214-1887(-)